MTKVPIVSPEASRLEGASHCPLLSPSPARPSRFLAVTLSQLSANILVSESYRWPEAKSRGTPAHDDAGSRSQGTAWPHRAPGERREWFGS